MSPAYLDPKKPVFVRLRPNGSVDVYVSFKYGDDLVLSAVSVIDLIRFSYKRMKISS